ncbi:hypothetical protein QQ045_009768 [Rhodiola kirilowii]
MANTDAKEPLLSRLEEPTIRTNENGVAKTKRRRLRRCRSAPLGDVFPPEQLGVSDSQWKSVFRNIHPNFRQIAMLLILYLVAGTICFTLVGQQISGKRTDGILDAVYFCIVTMTTVGYGDLVPDSAASKLLACAFVFSGMAVVGLGVSNAADCLVEKQEILLVRALKMRQKLGTTELTQELETNKVRYKLLMVLLLLAILITMGTVFLVFVEKLDFLDAFYCVCSTVTTLGYGDKSFSTTTGRVFAIFWILTSTITVAQFFLYLAELNTETRQKSLVKWVLSKRVTNVDLEAADLDNDGVVSASEFIIYKLKEMGKITQDDIMLVMDEFEELDVDQSGTLSPSDIILAQSSVLER